MRRVPAILIVVFLACPLLFAALTAVSLATWALDRHFYLSLVDDERLYQVTDALSSASWSTAQIDGVGGLQWKSVARAASVILTPDYLRTQAARVVNQVFDSMDGRARWTDVSVDARPAKEALLGDAGRKFARLLAEDLPVGGNVSDFSIRPGHLPVSRPASISVDRASALIQEGIPAFVGSIPDTVRFSDDHSARGSRVGTDAWGLGPRFHLLGTYLAACIVLLVIAGGFLAAAAFVGGETRFERLQWSGWSLLAPAAGILLVGLVVILVFISPWVQWSIETARLQTHGFSASFISAIIAAARSVVSRIGIGFLATGGVAAGIALGLLAWSWSIPHSERKGVRT
jgi:hypothetical protein